MFEGGKADLVKKAVRIDQNSGKVVVEMNQAVDGDISFVIVAESNDA